MHSSDSFRTKRKILSWYIKGLCRFCKEPTPPSFTALKVRLWLCMRDKDACVATVNSSLIHERQTRFGTDFWTHRPLEGRWILLEFLKHSHSQLSFLFCFYHGISKYSLRQLLRQLLTNIKTASVHSTRAYSHAENALLTVQSAELGYSHVKSCLAHCIGRCLVNISLESHLRVRHARGNSNDFLCPAFQKQGHESIEKMDSTNSIDSEMVNHILFKSFRIVAPVE